MKVITFAAVNMESAVSKELSLLDFSDIDLSLFKCEEADLGRFPLVDNEQWGEITRASVSVAMKNKMR